MGISGVLMSYNSVNRDKSVDGTWIRKSDNLMVKIDNERASILKEGDEKFPCDISSFSIYKDIRKVKDNLWTCKFLVVTMGSCNTEYEAGEMFINKEGELVIICGAFGSKVYSKMNPRYDSSQD
jgi:type IV secretory pathway ATPase VirB11/archaellum biosynthesis ATPase